MAKIYRVIQIKLKSVSLRKNDHMITDLRSVFKRDRSDKHLSEFLVFTLNITAKSTGIDMKQNYVTVTHM